MNSLAEAYGLLRSFLMYFAVPLRFRRLKGLYSELIQPGDLCFDVGAHLGSRLRVWSALGARVVAAEPQPRLMRLLRFLYGRWPNVSLVEAALGSDLGVGALYLSYRTPTVASLSPDWIAAVRQTPSFSHVRWDIPLRVPVITLDALIERYGEPAFCKIDVEGYEREVLQGLSRPLPALSIEYIPVARDMAIDCIHRLKRLGCYQYNWSVGESACLQPGGWIDAEELCKWLKYLSPGEPSGDIYARLI